MMNQLYYGDNLPIMRNHLPDACVDLVYLDPPFKSEKRDAAAAQIRAFTNTWHWDDSAENAYEQIMKHGGETAIAPR